MTYNYSTRSTVEGALFAALTAIIAVIGFYIPVLLFITGVLLPLPLTLVVYRHGLKKGILTLAVSYILLLILYSEPLSVTALMIQFAPLGLLLGLLFKNKITAGKSITACSIVSAFLTFIIIILTALLTGVELNYLETQMRSAVDESLEFYKDAGLLKNIDEQEYKQSMQRTLHVISILFPGILTIGAVMSSIITYLLARAVLKRLDHEVVPLPSFSCWTFPWYSLWSLVIGLALTLLGDRYQLETTAVIGKNILYVSCIIFIMLGISVVTYYYKKIPLHPLFKLILLLFAVIWPFTPVLLLGIGVIDPLIDIRRINKKKSLN
ncbi:MAG: YybS family protein [Desulfotomaculum sp.]|nr:YybS family protein [Desulfotomaculum sp.]